MLKKDTVKSVLIVTYYWPPAGGSGVRRWLNFSNLFHKHGWKPVVLRPLNADYPILDDSLVEEINPETEVVGAKIVEPFKIYAKFIGAKGEKVNQPGVLFQNDHPGIKERLSVWARSNIFIPDAKMLWMRSAVRKADNYLKNNQVDMIISTGPPHTTHLIAKKLKQKHAIPWIADFRDPWTQIDFFHKLKLTKTSLRKHKRLEHEVLTFSDAQTTVSWSWAEDLRKLGANQVHVVTNGFDQENYVSLDGRLDSCFSITHLGSMNEDRNHPFFWKVIRELIEEDDRFKKSIKIQLIGSLVPAVERSLQENELEAYCQKVPFMKHPDAIHTIASSRVLYLPLNDTPNVSGIVPGKVFEYLAVKRPVLAIGPLDGDIAKILKLAGNGVVCGFNDPAKLKDAIRAMFEDFLQKEDLIKSEGYKQFSRERLVQQYIDLMNSVVK